MKTCELSVLYKLKCPALSVELNKKNIFEKKFRIFKEKKIVFFAYVTPGVLKGSVKKFNAFGPAAGRLASNS